MQFTKQNHVSWCGRSQAQHVAARDAKAKLGFRTISLALHGTPQQPEYSCAMALFNPVSAAQSTVAQTGSQFSETFNGMAAKGLGPYLLTATGPAGGAIFAAAFRPMSQIPLTRQELTLEEFQTLNAEQHAAGSILLTADVFGTASSPRYCAVWVPNPDRVAWNTEALFDDAATLQQRFSAITSAWARPALIGVAEGGRHFQMFVDSRTAGWASRVGQSPSQFEKDRNALADQGLFPIAISAAGSGSAARIATIYQRDNDKIPRSFRTAGPVTVAAIDSGVEAYMRDHNLRGAALAIVKGTRLVYAKGYTFAEPEGFYPTVQPITPFRQASISKTFCAVAIWRLIQDGKLELDRPLQEVLHLKPFDGEPPVHATFGSIADVTIQHLLESISGINQDGIWLAREAAAKSGGLPANPENLARLIAGLNLNGSPGDRDNAIYGNTDYFLLSRVVAKLTGKQRFEDGLAELVLKPLGLKHTQGSRSHVGDQPLSEARYHMTAHDPYEAKRGNWALAHLETGKSVRTPLEPLVPTHYGTFDWEAFDGCGGLSSSVVDVARLYAQFACRSGNPVLSDQTLFDMMFLATIASAANKQPSVDDKGNVTLVGSHGYHGFDGVAFKDLTKRVAWIGKGGWLPGMGSTAGGATGEYMWIFAQNGNSLNGVATDWNAAVGAATLKDPFGPSDLFATHFGMAPLSEALPPAPPKPKPGLPALSRVPAAVSKPGAGLMEQTRRSLSSVRSRTAGLSRR